uniref:Uncharacterized protein n=1 Tax=Glossina brevipalpis TaxID=37001 RepID=A0A1A9WUY7_9MUSC
MKLTITCCANGDITCIGEVGGWLEAKGCSLFIKFNKEVVYLMQIVLQVNNVVIVQCSKLQYSTVHYSAVQCSVVQCNTVYGSVPLCNTMQQSIVHTLQYSTVHTLQYITLQYTTLCHFTVTHYVCVMYNKQTHSYVRTMMSDDGVNVNVSWLAGCLVGWLFASLLGRAIFWYQEIKIRSPSESSTILDQLEAEL